MISKPTMMCAMLFRQPYIYVDVIFNGDQDTSFDEPDFQESHGELLSDFLY